MNSLSEAEFPLISIITIVYNDVVGIEKTIKSVVDQSYRNFEYIVIDGGSNDGTNVILNKYLDKIDILISEPDNGIVDAFNKGTRIAKGSYFNYMNSGDSFLSEDSLNEFVIGIEESNADIVTAFSKFADKTIPKRKVTNSTFISERAMISHQASFIARDLFYKYGLYDENYSVRMDYEFWLRVMPFSSIYFIDKVLVNYIDGGVSGKNYIVNYREEVSSLFKNIKGFGLIICLSLSTSKFIVKSILKMIYKYTSFFRK